jgi:tRNA-specific 2-thiouridylase
VKTVYVGLSGGVDSAVAAHLLIQEGYDVVGAFIKGWEPDFLPCTGADDRLSAMRVAAHLGIPFVTVDLSKEYKKLVVDQFVADYKAGHTPNPDVLCNRTIKFGAFWEHVKKLGADYIATGHYAMTDSERLLVSNDPDKDQTYFLWTLTKDDLAHTLFPIGTFKKDAVRKIAEKAHLPNFARKDSQGLCFLGHVDMREFLKRYIDPKVGTVVDERGNAVGRHDGAWFYTLGQHIAVPGPVRHYVVEKDIKKNTLTVATTQVGHEARESYELADVQWVAGSMPKGAIKAQYRYHGPVVDVIVKNNRVKCAEPVLIAPGQSVVFFDVANKTCLGGGIVA